jgi:hypothetical protein
LGGEGEEVSGETLAFRSVRAGSLRVMSYEVRGVSYIHASASNLKPYTSNLIPQFSQLPVASRRISVKLIHFFLAAIPPCMI